MNGLFAVVILAGGLATRLRPLTDHVPKSMMEINGEPFIAHQLRLLKKQGIEQVIICIGYLGHMIQDYVGNGEKFNLQVSYALDGETLLGTAGAIKNAFLLLPEKFFVLYGDSYLPCDFSAVQMAFLNSHKPALMTVFKNHNNWDKSNIEFYDGEIFSYSKDVQTTQMKYIDYGLGIFHKTIFLNYVKTVPYDLSAVYQTLLAEQQLAAYEVKQRFYEVGSLNGIFELEQYIKCNI